LSLPLAKSKKQETGETICAMKLAMYHLIPSEWTKEKATWAMKQQWT